MPSSWLNLLYWSQQTLMKPLLYIGNHPPFDFPSSLRPSRQVLCCLFLRSIKQLQCFPLFFLTCLASIYWASAEFCEQFFPSTSVSQKPSFIPAATPVFSSSQPSNHLFSVCYRWGGMGKGREPVYARFSVRNRDLCITNLQTFRTTQA